MKQIEPLTEQILAAWSAMTRAARLGLHEPSAGTIQHRNWLKVRPVQRQIWAVRDRFGQFQPPFSQFFSQFRDRTIW